METHDLSFFLFCNLTIDEIKSSSRITNGEIYRININKI